MFKKKTFHFNPIKEEVVNWADQRVEATRRLHMLTESYSLNPDILKYWSRGVPCCSYTSVFRVTAIVTDQCHRDTHRDVVFTDARPVSPDSEIVQIIREFEVNHHSLVYYVLKNGPLLTLLSVSPYKEDWLVFDEYDFPEGIFSAYVHNFTYPQCSESGDVVIRSSNGALVRTA